MELQEMINESDRIVFFGGAGVSTESGIPDFRSVDGLYNQKYRWPPEMILSHSFYLNKPEEFFRFYRDKMLPLDAEPNAAHIGTPETAYGSTCIPRSGKHDHLHRACRDQHHLAHSVYLHTTAVFPC